MLKFIVSLFSLHNTRSWILSVITIILPWALFSYFLFYRNIIFYDPFSINIFLIEGIVALILLLFTRSMGASILVFYSIQVAPFILYYFLHRGIVYNDIYNLTGLISTLTAPMKVGLSLFVIIPLFLTIFCNIKKYSLKLLLVQLLVGSFLITGWYNPESSLAIIFSKQPKTESFNLSAAFRYEEVLYSLLFSMLDTRTFNNNLQSVPTIKNYNDFRSFKIGQFERRNIYVIILESFADPFDFNNIINEQEILNPIWQQWREEGTFIAMSPVQGGGSVQAEFELLCGVPSFMKYGYEYNRLGMNEIPCLPSYLKKYGYTTIGSQALYGSFFNIRNAYTSLGFEEIWLAEELDMTDDVGGWLTDESFFKQHLDRLAPYVKNGMPIFDFITALGCHGRPVIPSIPSQQRIYFEPSRVLESFLNCFLSSIDLAVGYVGKIMELDPNGIFIIVPDHPPPVAITHLREAGLKQLQSYPDDSNIPSKGFYMSTTPFSFPKHIAYYELPELLVDILSDGRLCKSINCWSNGEYLNHKGRVIRRSNFATIEMDPTSMHEYHEKINRALIKESVFGRIN